MTKDPRLAFPVTNKEHHDVGMELRDYFAAKALPHALARERWAIDRYYGDKSAQDHVPSAAREAYRIADAMMEAREK